MTVKTVVLTPGATAKPRTAVPTHKIHLSPQQAARIAAMRERQSKKCRPE
jgi:hypothetical protein